MNHQINAQVKNMIAVTKAFAHGCTLASIEDDGIVSKDEEKALKRIQTASEKFIKELEKIG